MAAAIASMRTALGRLGFSDESARVMTDGQGLIDCLELGRMRDSDVTSLCKVLRSPGGTVANDVAAIAAGGNAVVRNPGTEVTNRAEANLKLACYLIRHGYRVATPVIPDRLILTTVHEIEALKLGEEDHKNPANKPVIDDTNWPANIEALEEYFRGYLGVDGIPLAYIIRRPRIDERVAIDPIGGFGSVQDEMIHRAPHLAADGTTDLASYRTDRLKVWELLAEICRNLDCFTYIKPEQRLRDGRRAFWRLHDHYLGPNNVDNMATLAETKLQVTSYQGEKKNWNFEKYCRCHVNQHAILERLVEHGYSGIDERSKVRHLLEGIKFGGLDVVKTQILANAGLRNSFDRCVSLYKDYICQMKSSNPSELNISDTTTTDSDVKPVGKAIVEDIYYPPNEYKKLSDEQKLALMDARKARGHEGRGSGKRQKTNHKTVAKLQRTIAKLKTALSKSNDDSTSESSEDEIEDSKPAAKGNRNNKALTRQKKVT